MLCDTKILAAIQASYKTKLFISKDHREFNFKLNLFDKEDRRSNL